MISRAVPEIRVLFHLLDGEGPKNFHQAIRNNHLTQAFITELVMPLNINCYSHLFYEKNERNKKRQLFIITAFCVNHYIT